MSKHNKRPKPEPRTEERRNFLKWGLGAATLTVAGGAIYYLGTGKDEPLTIAPMPETPIKQADVDREYAEIYRRVEHAKKEAEAEGKKLVVLGGEAHICRNSLLLQFILADIASRPKIDIKDSIEEHDRHLVARENADATDKANARDKANEAELKATPDHAKSFVRQACYITTFKRFKHNVVQKLEEPDPHNTFLSLAVGKDAGIRYHGIDPKHDARFAAAGHNDEQGVYGDNEVAMLDATAELAKDRHCFGCLGMAHVPEFCDKLPQRGIKVLGIDCSAGMRISAKGISRQRIDALDRNEDIYKPSIRSAIQLSPADSLAMTLKASIKHQLEHGELTQEEAKSRHSLVEDKVIGRSR